MIPVTSMQGQTVALFGLGGSGLVTARALEAGGARVIAFDDNPTSVARAQDAGLTTADLRHENWAAFSALVLAPGVPLTHPKPHWSVDLAKAAGVPVIGDVDLFCRELAAADRRAPLVAITGTNGKSTTTALIAHVLAHAGRNVQMGGNIGRAVLDLDPIAEGADAASQVYVIECSSYQIDLAPTLSPHVGVLLNITPDHLERHGTLDHYASIKERLVARADLAAVGVDDALCQAICVRLRDSAHGIDRAVVSFAATSGLSTGQADIVFADGALVQS
ncbi:MAG: Mur ligase family protein, partial [Pseudomonadota bacterium]